MLLFSENTLTSSRFLLGTMFDHELAVSDPLTDPYRSEFVRLGLNVNDVERKSYNVHKNGCAW